MFATLAAFVDGIRPKHRHSVARESVGFLAQQYEIPRYMVTLVAEGYDPKKRQTWALVQAELDAGGCCALTIEPDDGQIQHEHRRFE